MSKKMIRRISLLIQLKRLRKIKQLIPKKRKDPKSILHQPKSDSLKTLKLCLRVQRVKKAQIFSAIFRKFLKASLNIILIKASLS